MRKPVLAATLAILGTALAAGPALAQAAMGERGRMPPRQQRMASPEHDRGMTRPDVNAAYMGGGVILEGAPGAPAPMPEPTPPGQRPRNMVDR